MQAEESMASLRTEQLVEDVAFAEAHLASNTPKSITPNSVASDNARQQPSTQAGMCSAVGTTLHQSESSHRVSLHAASTPAPTNGEGTCLTQGVAAEVVDTEELALESDAHATLDAAVCPQYPHDVIA